MRVDYEVRWDNPASHLFTVSMRVEGVLSDPVEVAMPAWIPGAYEVLDSAKHVSRFEAKGARGALRFRKTDKQTWRIACPGERAIEIRYRCYANTVSCIASSLDSTHAHLTGGTVLLYVVGGTEVPCTLRVQRPAKWQIATGLEHAGSPDRFRAETYDALIDAPVEIGAFLHDRFAVAGRPHHLAIHPYGKEEKNRGRLARDLRRVAGFFAGLFGGLPFREYWFLFHLHPTIAKGGALEHGNSTHLTLPVYLDSEDPEDYDRIVDVAAHEYFHLWNVKRIRPKGLGPFDYAREVHTTDLWVAEGLTDYYAPLSLRRSGVWDDRRFFRRIARAIERLADMPGRGWMSVKESSWETWTQAHWHRPYSRDDANLLNQFTDYYTKGSLVGLALDLEIRVRTGGRKSLDDVFRLLMERFAPAPEGFPEGAFEAAASEIAAADLSRFFRDYVEGTREMDFARVLRAAGLRVRRVPRTKKDDEGKYVRKIVGALGVELDDRGEAPRIVNVLPDSPAEAAGLDRDDLLLAADGERLTSKNWRTLFRSKPAGRDLDLALFRHDRLHHLSLRVADDPRRAVRIEVDPDAGPAARRLRRGWLGPDPSKRKDSRADGAEEEAPA
ncbi:MAG TPA: PDZ domain-containing protein [Planctomycetota bacterium]|jgi:predicted metalloprotease with PDZ domain|nr:PDZ domain-containing protein [Planctomycetota bacterium]